MQQVPARIAGRPVTADRWLSVHNPYDGTEVARVPALGAEHVDQAGRAAAALVAAGPPLDAEERAVVLESAAALLTDRTGEFAYTIVAEAGKPAAAARREVDQAARALRTAAAEGRHLASAVPPLPSSASVRFTLHDPVGPVAAVTGYQLPLALAAARIGPAVAAGCPVLLKPSAKAPVSAVRLVDLLVEAGLPDAWVSVLTGDSCTGAALVKHQAVRLVTFAGGTTISAAGRVLLDHTAVCPVIVEPDADLAEATEAITAGAFGFAGQLWSASRRVIVHRDVQLDLADRLASSAAALVVGDPADPATDLGPVISTGHAQRLTELLPDLDVRSRPPAPAVPLIAPRLTDHVVDAPGPVLSIEPYADLDEAFALASGGRAAIFTRDVRTAVWAARALPARSVLVNAVPDVGPLASDSPQAPAAALHTDRRTVLLAG
ncbi:aldehyde dehydrogenase family protein [Fodinicola acaciae]|uniref:aldehyde dehydrogenase family protein n=1 Tax=Fodinicola acaciae TaxID=2681555 RepID=UPI0013D8C671|nr:aldehyde dehydrogenase family protein [Fodinicola acaciae]